MCPVAFEERYSNPRELFGEQTATRSRFVGDTGDALRDNVNIRMGPAHWIWPQNATLSVATELMWR